MAGAKSFTIYTKFAVKNGFTGPVLAMAKGADKLNQKLAMAGKTAQKFGAGLVTAGKVAGAAALGAAAAGAAVFKLAQGSAAAADDILNTANSLGLSTKALQEYRYAGIAAGLTTEEMDAALRKLTVNLGKDSEDVENALYQIGLTADQLKAAGPDQSLEMIARGFQKVTDPTKKAAVAAALFGKSSVRMVNALSGGPEAIEALRKEAQEIGYVMDGDALKAAGNLDDMLDRLGATATGLGNRLAARVMPQVTKFVDGLSKGIQPGGKFDKVLESIGKFLGGGADTLGPVFDKILDFIPKLADFGAGLLKSLEPVLKPLLGMLTPILKIIENLMPLINSLVSVVSTILGPIMETLKWVLEGVAKLTGKEFAAKTPEYKAAVATAAAVPGGGAALSRSGISTPNALDSLDPATRAAYQRAGIRTPLSPNSGMAGSTNTTTTSRVELMLQQGLVPVQKTKAPGVTINTGNAWGMRP